MQPVKSGQPSKLNMSSDRIFIDHLDARSILRYRWLELGKEPLKKILESNREELKQMKQGWSDRLFRMQAMRAMAEQAMQGLTINE